ncbi:MAG: DinB family protein [Planctomycetota bacterium]|jgi:hypothetical protein|nr:DinB family protein [Planctomycetota bacterium]MDP6938439.1 DinB family protein [Planctomycetota bacterium]
MDLDEDLIGLQAALNCCQDLGGRESVRDAGDPGVSGWTAAQHLYHTALACDLSLRNVEGLVAQKGLLIVKGAQTSEETIKLLAKEEFQRGQAESPRMVRPDTEVNPQFLAREQEGNQATLESLRRCRDEIATAPDHIPHQVLGPLTAAMWLRFARLHTLHHLAIIEDILTAIGLSRSE